MASEREQLRQRTLAGFFNSFPELADHSQGEVVANLVFSTLRGMAMNELFKMPKEASAKQLKMLADFVAMQCRNGIFPN
jgi:hypothetical protein